MPIDWQSLFTFQVSPLEIFLRGSAVYLFIFFAFRFVLQRDVGAVGIADVLLLVLVADASQNAMATNYDSLVEGLVLVSTLLGWNLLFDWLSFRFAAMRRLLQPQPLCLIRDGRLMHRNLRREFISEDELLAQLRQHGVEEISEVRRAYMESDGTVSVIPYEKSKEADNNSSATKRPF